MDLFRPLFDHGYENLIFCSDEATGLRGLICLHDTSLGPALGGTRALRSYPDEAAAVTDVIRLARGMTYKAALAGLPHGGGKAVIWLQDQGAAAGGDALAARSALFRSFGRAVERLGGSYITTEDSGTSPSDMRVVRTATRHVVGIPADEGGSGDPSPMTAFGVLRGIEAAVRVRLKRHDLEGLTVALQGVGHVGFPLARLLKERGANLMVHDVNEVAVERAVNELGARAVKSEDELLNATADVYSPCALGGAINDRSLALLKVKIIAGAANNQLARPELGEQLQKKGILYAPDYAINAGGLINVAQEVKGYDALAAKNRTAMIYDVLTMIFEQAEREGMPPERVADQRAEETIANARINQGLPPRRVY